MVRRGQSKSFVIGLVFGVSAGFVPQPAQAVAKKTRSAESPTGPQPRFDDAFWEYWGDGQAEVAGYALTKRRYGALRRGTAVTVFVTETFSDSARVKADPGRHPASDTFPVLKLNLVHDFPTGVYDYNLMTSTFVALVPRGARPAGTPTKISFTGQEWCGHVYQHWLFDPDRIRSRSHSYFDGEADQSADLPYPAAGLTEDSLFHWARGLAGPAVAMGTSQTRPGLRSLAELRLKHQNPDWETVTLRRSRKPQSLTAGADTYRVHTATAKLTSGRQWTFWVEDGWPHRIVKWEVTAQAQLEERAELLGVRRLKYWELNHPEGTQVLKEIGLAPRGPRMP